MFDVSLPWANFWYAVSNLTLIVGAVAVAIGTIGSIKMGTVRERFSDERTATLETEAARAKADLGMAQADIAKANAAASRAAEGAAEANRVAEQERLERVKLELKIAPRRLSGEQIGKMVVKLTGIAPIEIGVVSRLLDAEGNDFAEDLATAFKTAHLRPTRFLNWTRSDKGVFIATVEGTNLPLERAALIGALNAANIAYQSLTMSGEDLNRISPSFQPGILYVLVGAKP